jgi:magnesium chelatase family protein
MRKRHIRRHCAIDAACQLLLRQATDTLGFSARAYDKILKVARTIADLDGAESIAPHHISEVHPPAVRHTAGG